ncbi:hypothetical protein [Hymenobacter roseosalivarius]|nr:hypothetical protein [Hymenobacter roseosalivarius]
MGRTRPVVEFKFKSIFGAPKKDSTLAYCLLGTGFYKSRRAKTTDTLIASWIKQHPTARVIPVSTIESTMLGSSNSSMTYCWLVDKDDNLNLYLIQNGCFPGGTMQKPKAGVKTHVSKKEYEEFMLQVRLAELYAQKKKLGVWVKE